MVKHKPFLGISAKFHNSYHIKFFNWKIDDDVVVCASL